MCELRGLNSLKWWYLIWFYVFAARNFTYKLTQQRVQRKVWWQIQLNQPTRGRQLCTRSPVTYTERFSNENVDRIGKGFKTQLLCSGRPDPWLRHYCSGEILEMCQYSNHQQLTPKTIIIIAQPSFHVNLHGGLATAKLSRYPGNTLEL